MKPEMLHIVSIVRKIFGRIGAKIARKIARLNPMKTYKVRKEAKNVDNWIKSHTFMCPIGGRVTQQVCEILQSKNLQKCHICERRKS